MPGTITTKFFVVFKNASGKELRRGFTSEDDRHAHRVVRIIAIRSSRFYSGQVVDLGERCGRAR
jgi:hypothetical protein